ncbi:hypothetical protein BP5796_01479 [Coleophoma crateriformis]|uniref:Uncharacterized protein n=1 Tax=Coleophoma crateriformis TaxID=565419 RepID=A0A3D8T0I8_9HELO|nr:hypothetical protein BP5796_01479 [Coleophoma crateriformis]
MPNHPVVVSGAIIVVSVAVAAAIAVYESPQARQFAEDVRRRIAVALHSLGDEIHDPARSQQPRFNRPEDAEGFMRSANAPGVDADEETKRRQRDELMYWNAVKLERQEKERKLAEANRPANPSRGSSFDDFLSQDHTAEKGTYVYNSGADLHNEADDGLIRRRGDGARGMNRGSIYANPFADENGIDSDTQRAIDESLLSPEVSEKWESSDIYDASPRPRSATLVKQEVKDTPLIDTSEPAAAAATIQYPDMASGQHETAAFRAAQDEAANNVFASIHAWADHSSNQSFYSPLAQTTRSPSPQQAPPSLVLSAVTDDSHSESEQFESGQATPTDSISMAGDAEEVWGPRSGATSEHEIMSVEDSEGMRTPDTWTEVGSIVSENDIAMHH